MKTCITIWHWPEHPRWYDEGLKQSLANIYKAGFTHINWNPDSGSSYWYAQSEIEFIRDSIAAHNLKSHSIHSSDGCNSVTEFHGVHGFRETRKNILSVNRWQRRAGIELLKNRVDLAHAIGAPNIVLHVGIQDIDVETQSNSSTFFKLLFESLDELKPYCLEKHVQIAVENLFLYADTKTFFILFEELFQRYEKEFVGLCYDSGHWELLAPGDISLLDTFGERLIATHIHDNFGAKDDHLLPFDGRLNWDLITNAIAKTPYETPLNFETPKDRYSITDTTFYRRAFFAAEKLERMITTHRI